MAKKFTIVLQGVDRLPNSSVIVNTIKSGLNDVFRSADRDLEILVDRGIVPKHGDLTLTFDTAPKFSGPGTPGIWGDAASRTVFVDEHQQARLRGGVRSQIIFDKGTKQIVPDYISQIQTVFEPNDIGLARFLGNTAVHEIGHLLEARHPNNPDFDHSLNPNDVMFQGVPKTAKYSLEAARRYLGGAKLFIDGKQSVINYLKNQSNTGSDLLGTNSQSGPPSYQVRQGDSLSKIAKSLNTDWKSLYNANRGVIGADPNRIFPGQKLVVPVKQSGGISGLEMGTGIRPSISDQSASTRYTVQRGDSLSKIAQRLNTDWKSLYQANRSTIGGDPNRIFPGQKFIVPVRQPFSISGLGMDIGKSAGTIGGLGFNTGPRPSIPDRITSASYVVQRGDSLSKIAQRLNTDWKSLYNANRNVIGGDPNRIYPGQRFIVPVQPMGGISGSAMNLGGVAGSTGGFGMDVGLRASLQDRTTSHRYTVQQGDSLSRIAQRLNTDWRSLYTANRNVIGGDPNRIFPGQKIIIPGMP